MKNTTIALLLLIIVSTGYAQSDDSGFHFGVKAQPALAWFRIDASKESGLKSDGLPFGFGYGFITEFRLAKHYSFATGLEVAYRGGKIKQVIADNNSTTVATAKYSLQFIELPATLKLKTSEIGYLTYYFQAGLAPGIAIRTRKNIEVQTDGITLLKDNNADASDDINEFNLSMILSAGVEYNISGNTSLLFGITFNNGFLDILDDKPYDDRVKGASNFLALTLGVLF